MLYVRLYGPRPEKANAALPLLPPHSGSAALPLESPHARPNVIVGVVKSPGRLRMVFRRDSKVDAFQRQISALRHQLGGELEPVSPQDADQYAPERTETRYRSAFPDLDAIGRDVPRQPRGRDMQPELLEGFPALPAIPSVDNQTSVVAHSTAWNGDLQSSGSLHVHGRVEGSIAARDDIFVAEEADVEATLNAASVTVAGKVRGSIHCGERFEILPRGRFAGDVQAPVIVVHDGALVTGQITMTTVSDSKTMAPAAVRIAHGGD